MLQSAVRHRPARARAFFGLPQTGYPRNPLPQPFHGSQLVRNSRFIPAPVPRRNMIAYGRMTCPDRDNTDFHYRHSILWYLFPPVNMATGACRSSVFTPRSIRPHRSGLAGFLYRLRNMAHLTEPVDNCSTQRYHGSDRRTPPGC